MEWPEIYVGGIIAFILLRWIIEWIVVSARRAIVDFLNGGKEEDTDYVD